MCSVCTLAPATRSTLTLKWRIGKHHVHYYEGARFVLPHTLNIRTLCIFISLFCVSDSTTICGHLLFLLYSLYINS